MNRKLLSEFVGVFLIVLLGYGSVAAAASGVWQPGPYGVPAVFGVAVALAIQFLGPFSIHFNPGVTVALGFMRWHPWQGVWPFIAVQFAAALAAMGVIHAVFPSVIQFGAPSAQEGWRRAMPRKSSSLVPLIFLGRGGGPTIRGGAQSRSAEWCFRSVRSSVGLPVNSR